MYRVVRPARQNQPLLAFPSQPFQISSSPHAFPTHMPFSNPRCPKRPLFTSTSCWTSFAPPTALSHPAIHPPRTSSPPSNPSSSLTRPSNSSLCALNFPTKIFSASVRPHKSSALCVGLDFTNPCHDCAKPFSHISSTLRCHVYSAKSSGLLSSDAASSSSRVLEMAF
jgi:hypothetical protein